MGNIFAAGPGVIVTPTNSCGDMSGGIDLQLSALFVSLQDRLQTYISHQPSKRLPIGRVVWAKTGDETHPLVIFSPTFRTALDLATSGTRIYRAAFAVFASVQSYNASGTKEPITTVLMPGFGTGLGEMEPTLAARRIFQAYQRSLNEDPQLLERPVVLSG